MTSKKARMIADKADLVVCGYAMLIEGENVKIVNLESGRVLLVSSDLRVLETTMDDIEIVIALKYLSDNRKFMAA